MRLNKFVLRSETLYLAITLVPLSAQMLRQPTNAKAACSITAAIGAKLLSSLCRKNNPKENIN